MCREPQGILWIKIAVAIKSPGLFYPAIISPYLAFDRLCTQLKLACLNIAGKRRGIPNVDIGRVCAKGNVKVQRCQVFLENL